MIFFSIPIGSIVEILRDDGTRVFGVTATWAYQTRAGAWCINLQGVCGGVSVDRILSAGVRN